MLRLSLNRPGINNSALQLFQTYSQDGRSASATTDCSKLRSANQLIRNCFEQTSRSSGPNVLLKSIYFLRQIRIHKDVLLQWESVRYREGFQVR